LVQKWIDQLNEQHVPLVRQLFATLSFSES
jgi:hypothetical protein